MIASRRIFAAALFAMSFSAAARAQTTRSVEVFGGYAFAHDALNNVSLPAGWLAGGAVGVNGWLSAIVDISGGYKTLDVAGSDIRLSAHAAMIGGRASARIGRLTEFGELLAGIVRGSGAAFGFTSTTNALAVQPGVGVDCPIGPRVALRGQLDVRLIRSQPGGNEAGYEYRFSSALVYRFR
jgi:hypothetical protein